MLKISEVTHPDQFEMLRNTWNKTLKKTKNADIFSTWEWQTCWWRHFGKNRRLRILIAEENGRVAGIAPLMLSEYHLLHIGKINKVEFIGTPNSDYQNFLLPNKEGRCIRHFLNHMLQYDDWDMLEFREVSKESISAKILLEMQKKAYSELGITTSAVCPYLKLPHSISQFLTRLSKNMKKNLRKRERRLREKYDVQVKTQEDFKSIEDAMHTFFNLHQKRWRSRERPGAFSDKAFCTFHIELAQTFAQKGWLSLYFLTADDEPISGIYSFNYSQKKYGYLTGFDPRFQRFGVGNMLKIHAIEDAINKGLKEYDLTRGHEEYKREWATGARKNLAITIVQKGLIAKVYDWSTRRRLIMLLPRRLREQLILNNN